MINILRYKADHIKARIRPEFFSEVADFLEKEQRPKGRWIIYPQNGMEVCNQCKGIRRDYRVGYGNFCNKCGADMREVTE